jgi:hypothetical protein
MNDVNSNFLDTDIEEIVEEIEEEVIEETEEAEATTSIINEAIARIEQAKLYEALLNHQLFAPGSARPEIIKAVRKEFKEFIQFRLEVLLGIKADGKPGHIGSMQPIQVKSPFSDEETVALKDIARKLVEKNRLVSSVPSISAVQVPQPQIQELPTTHQHVQVAPPVAAPAPTTTTRKTVTRRVVKRNGQVISTEDVPAQAAAPAAPAKPNAPRKKSNNVNAFTGQDLSQAVSTIRPPQPMPSQAQMDMLNARQVARIRNSPGIGEGGGGSDAGAGTGSLSAALDMMLKQR